MGLRQTHLRGQQLAALPLQLLRPLREQTSPLLVLRLHPDQPVALCLDGGRQPVELALTPIQIRLALDDRRLAGHDLDLARRQPNLASLLKRSRERRFRDGTRLTVMRQSP